VSLKEGQANIVTLSSDNHPLLTGAYGAIKNQKI
jgi:hypothetical protein